MMISPESYYEEHLKGKDYRQIISIIRGLKNEMGRLKKINGTHHSCKKFSWKKR